MTATTGSSVGAEIEQLALDQLAYLEGTDEPTRQLIADLLNEIELIQTRTGKRWHKDLVTWSAVSEMMQQGPIKEKNPDRIWDDEAVSEAYKVVYSIEQTKKDLCKRLRELGISVSPENPTKQKPLRRGLFGTRGTANALAYFIRDSEQAAIDNMPDGPDKEHAQELFTVVRRLDADEEEADAHWTETMRPYWDSTARGRDLYRDILKARAEAAMNAGKPFDYNHLSGWY